MDGKTQRPPRQNVSRGRFCYPLSVIPYLKTSVPKLVYVESMRRT